MKKAAAAGLAGGFLALPALALGILAAASGSYSTAAAVQTYCATAGPVAQLDAVQARNARTIVAATRQATADQSPAVQEHAELIALMTAATESTLHNYSNPTVPGSAALPNDGPPPSGGDHDSVGLFQQRASWGPLTQRMEPISATQLFIDQLDRIPGWLTMPAGDAAQAVQQSQYPDRYARQEQPATRWLQQITGSSSSPTSSSGTGSSGSGTGSGDGSGSCDGDGLPPGVAHAIPAGRLPPGYAIPPSATDAERRAVTFALAQLGKPYVFGAVGPDTFDCSGLTLAAWASAGVLLPHYTVAQFRLGVPVADLSVAAPGDLVFIPGDDGSVNPPDPQHVGMYLGGGYVIEAPQTGDVVKIVPTAGFGPVLGIRHYG